MKNKNSMVIVIVIILAGFAAYFYWQHSQQEAELAQAQVSPPLPVAPPVQPLPLHQPEISQLIEAPVAIVQLPQLGKSDSFVLDALSGLVGNRSLMKFFKTERIVRHIVATVDNLPRKHVSMSVMPLKRVSGMFAIEGTEAAMTISPKNALRYTSYVRIARAVDAPKLVALYIRLYPLFQDAYEELGYPKKYFNNRLIVALDNLLAAPDIKEPVKLVRPKIYYQFADPDLEGRSIGQRILMRIGSSNEAAIKRWLKQIKQELMLHTHEKKIERAGNL